MTVDELEAIEDADEAIDADVNPGEPTDEMVTEAEEADGVTEAEEADSVTEAEEADSVTEAEEADSETAPADDATEGDDDVKGGS